MGLWLGVRFGLRNRVRVEVLVRVGNWNRFWIMVRSEH